MSIASEITRLQGVKADILQAITDKGVTVPSGSALDDCPGLIGSIQQGGSVEIGGCWYRTIVVGGKVWLAENLDYKFQGCHIGGSEIPTTPNAWYYDNDETLYSRLGYRCGLLYNWYAVKLLNDNRASLCPGWHVPTKDEWDAFITSVGGLSTAGTKLKSLDNTAAPSWPSGWNGSDDYGFSVLPTGFYHGLFYDLNNNTRFWTITEDENSKAFRIVFETTPALLITSVGIDYAFSVRLVKD